MNNSKMHLIIVLLKINEYAFFFKKKLIEQKIGTALTKTNIFFFTF